MGSRGSGGGAFKALDHATVKQKKKKKKNEWQEYVELLYN